MPTILDVIGNVVDHVLSDLVGLFEALDLDVQPLRVSLLALELDSAAPEHLFEDLHLRLFFFQAVLPFLHLTRLMLL